MKKDKDDRKESNKDDRQVRICGKGSYNHEKSPIITLHGKWLREYGFDIGDYINYHCEEGKIIITKAETEPRR